MNENRDHTALQTDLNHPGGFAWIEELQFLQSVTFDLQLGVTPQSASLSLKEGLLFTNLLKECATTRAARESKSVHIVGLSILPYYSARQTTIEYSLPTGSETLPTGVAEVFESAGKKLERVGDAIGGVFARTLAMIVNEAAFALQENVASAADIDAAMKLGTNYPIGPLAFCDEIGAATVVAILDALSAEYGADRYRAAALLRRTAEAGGRFHA